MDTAVAVAVSEGDGVLVGNAVGRDVLVGVGGIRVGVTVGVASAQATSRRTIR